MSPGERAGWGLRMESGLKPQHAGRVDLVVRVEGAGGHKGPGSQTF